MEIASIENLCIHHFHNDVEMDSSTLNNESGHDASKRLLLPTTWKGYHLPRAQAEVLCPVAKEKSTPIISDDKISLSFCLID